PTSGWPNVRRARNLHRWRGSWALEGGSRNPAVRDPQVAGWAELTPGAAGGAGRRAWPVLSLRVSVGAGGGGVRGGGGGGGGAGGGGGGGGAGAVGVVCAQRGCGDRPGGAALQPGGPGLLPVAPAVVPGEHARGAGDGDRVAAVGGVPPPGGAVGGHPDAA